MTDLLLHQPERQVVLDDREEDHNQPEAERNHWYVPPFLIFCGLRRRLGSRCLTSGFFAFSVYQIEQTFCLLANMPKWHTFWYNFFAEKPKNFSKGNPAGFARPGEALVRLLHQPVRKIKLDARDDERSHQKGERGHWAFLLSCLIHSASRGRKGRCANSDPFAFIALR